MLFTDIVVYFALMVYNRALDLGMYEVSNNII